MQQSNLFTNTRYQELITELNALAEELKPFEVSSPEDVIKYATAKLSGKKSEEMLIIITNAKNKIVFAETIAQGTIDQVIIYPRNIIKTVLDHSGTGLIMVHNHPSNECDPSAADIRLTNNVAKGAEFFDITLHDHIIIGTGKYLSFKEEGLI